MTEVVIVGGGVIGLSLALGLASQRRKVTLLDKASFIPDGQPPLQRIYAINPSSHQLLTRLGIWQRLPQQAYAPYQRMHVWDGLSSGEINFDARYMAKPCLGWMVDEFEIKRVAAELVKQHPLIASFEHQTLKSFQTEETGVGTVVTNVSEWHAKLVVGCDGAESWLREQAGFDLHKKPYGHDALICHLMSEKPHHQTAYQRFTPQGPLAFLPLPQPHQESVVYSADPQTISDMIAMDDEAFCAELAQRFEGRLGTLSSPSPRHRFTLYQRQASPYVKGCCVLVGDALHTVHPLAGLGANMGLGDVAALMETLEGEALGNPLTLRRYERARKAEVCLIMGAIGKLQQLFSPNSVMPHWLRGSGMRWLDRQHGLKRRLIRMASEV